MRLSFGRSVLLLAALFWSGAALAQSAGGGLHRAGDLLYRDPRTVPWLIQDRIVPPAKSLGASLSVDLTSEMPPVGDQGQQGSCTAWAMAYYHKTHNEWVEHHWDVDSTKYQASPAFVYNQINGGEDQGSNFEDAQKLMCQQGAASMKEMPYSDNDCTTWPAESVYLHAIPWRCDSSYWINIGNDTGLARVKARLDSGYTTTLGIWVWGNFDNIQNYNYTYCESQITGYDRGGHAVTFVGYDDTMTTADGKGAFRMVNSWGTGWGQSGYWWMSYQAVKDTDSYGSYGLTSGGAYYVSDKLNYAPTLLGRVKITHSFRDCVEIRLGVGRSASPLWTKNFRGFDMRQWNVVPQPFPDNNIVFDMSDGASYLANGSTDSIFVRCLDDSSDGLTGTINYFSGQYLPWGATGVAVDTPVSIPDYNVAAYARAMIPVGQDVGCTRIIAPMGSLDSGASVTPACSTYNYGTTSASYLVRMKIGTGYNQTASVSNQAPGARTYVAFPSWTARPRGSIAVSCSTELATDTNHANDRQTGDVTVVVHDVGATAIIAPKGGIDSGTAVPPQAIVRNFGTVAEDFEVRFLIQPAYVDSQSVNLAAGAIDTVSFAPWIASPLGRLTTKCTTLLAGDLNPANNLVRDSVLVSPQTGMEEGQLGLPHAFALEEPKPNPFTQQTMIRYALPQKSAVALGVYSVTGKLLKTLVNGSQAAGCYSLPAADLSLPEGIYLLRAQFGTVSFTRKLVKIQ